MSYYTDIKSPYIWTHFWRGQVLYQVVCVLHKILGWRNLLQHQQWNYRHSHSSANPPFGSHFRSDTIFEFFLGKSKIQRTCVRYQHFELVNITEIGDKVVVQLEQSQLCVLMKEEPDIDWLFVFNLCFVEFNFRQWIVHMIYLWRVYNW